MNSIVGPYFKVFFFFNKVLVGPVNSARDPLEKHKFAFSFCMGPTMHMKCSSKKKKKKVKCKGSAFQHYPNEGLFLLLFMSSTALFGTIHGSYCIISANFYLYLQYLLTVLSVKSFQI